jgi:oxaloacetate decarboxylase gamma subunit
MTIVEMLGQSSVLTLLGMGIVFSFLIIMVICVTMVGKVIHALGADKDVMIKPAPAGTVNAGNAAGAVTAAITAAVNEYRKTNS